MKEKIETKVHEILDYILAKDASQISYNEYKILDNKLKNIIMAHYDLISENDESTVVAEFE